MTARELQGTIDGLRDLLWAERQHHALTRSELDQARAELVDRTRWQLVEVDRAAVGPMRPAIAKWIA